MKIKDRENVPLFINACVGTVLVFCVFLGQTLFSDVVTFAKSGDEDRLCYAAFMKIRECIVRGESFVGVDSGSFNGATEFYLRSNIPVAYIGFYIFAALAVVFPPRMMYLLFYACHMFISLYVVQKLGKKYFELDNKILLIVTSLLLYLLCIEAWYISFFVITAFTVILLYTSLEAFYEPSIKHSLMLLFCVVLSLTSGYVTVSCFLLVAIYIFSLVFICSKKEDRKVSNIVKYTLHYVCGGILVVPYLLQLLVYVSKVVNGNTNLSDAIFYRLRLSDLYSVFSSTSFTTYGTTEGIETLSLGFITCIVLIYSVFDGQIQRLSKRLRSVVILNFVVWLLIIIWSTESSTALSGWMYSLLPILGSMHIPSRYLMVTLPFLYIAIGILAQNIEWGKYNKSLKFLIGGVGGIVIWYMTLSKMGKAPGFIIEDRFLLECILTMLFLIALLQGKGEKIYDKGNAVILIWSFSIIISGITHFYLREGVYSPASVVKNSSIIYNQAAIETIDNYISTTTAGNKEEYRWVAYDSVDGVPYYLMSNYEWYDYSTYSLSNYTGYEIQLCTPLEYREMTPWFNIYNWEYIVNTRADFMLTDYATIDANRAFFDTIIDWNKGVADIGSGRIMVSLYKFIPSTICGTAYVYEDTNSFDNGFFYSHDLTNDNIVDFKTDENSYYELIVDSDKDSVLAFLPYANRNYHYYVDGIEQSAEIINMQAIVRLEAGKHAVRIEYQNTAGEIGWYLIMATDMVLILFLLFYFAKENVLIRRRIK